MAVPLVPSSPGAVQLSATEVWARLEVLRLVTWDGGVVSVTGVGVTVDPPSSPPVAGGGVTVDPPPVVGGVTGWVVGIATKTEVIAFSLALVVGPTMPVP